MKFSDAYNYLKRGHNIKLPEWGGYWAWDKAMETIVIHTREGAYFDIRETDHLDYTISFMFRDDWELIIE